MVYNTLELLLFVSVPVFQFFYAFRVVDAANHGNSAKIELPEVGDMFQGNTAEGYCFVVNYTLFRCTHELLCCKT